MFNVCPNCGAYCVEKMIDQTGPYAICPHCQHAHPFLQQPLFIITGPSGAGKTTVCLDLVTDLRECVVMESDILWGLVGTADNGYQEYRNTWLRVAKNIGQAGRPVVLCGTALPDQFEGCPERRYISTLHYLALVCSDELLQERLEQRPRWRSNRADDIVKHMLQFNRWLKAHACTTNPPITLCDNTDQTPQETRTEIAQWVRARL